MLEKKRREDLIKTMKDIEISYGIHNFEEYYKDQLLRDSKKPARKINEEEYLIPKKINQNDVFMNVEQREEQYFKDYDLYKENKSKIFMSN